MFRPIWGTALARSGGGLYSLCLSAHPEMMVAVSPNIQLFRSFRNAVVRHANRDSLSRAVRKAAPILDWYGTDDRVRGLDYFLHDATLDVPFDDTEWDEFLSASIARGRLDAADLAEHYHRLQGATYRDMFANLLDIIADVRDARDRRWVGFHEAWTLDTYPALVRAFPESRILIAFRDPRGVVNSMLGVKRIDPAQVAQVLSYVRHWRKYVAVTLQLLSMPLFRGRLHVTAYDLIVTRPRETVDAICRAFDVEFDERMLDVNNFYDYASGTVWAGNSSFGGRTEGISAHLALRWRQDLNPTILKTVEYLCGPELKLLGYPAVTKFADPDREADGDITAFLLKDHAGFANWRSDLGDPLADLGVEAVRRQLLRMPDPCQDVALVRRCFLFENVYTVIRQGDGPLLPALAEGLFS